MRFLHRFHSRFMNLKIAVQVGSTPEAAPSRGSFRLPGETGFNRFESTVGRVRHPSDAELQADLKRILKQLR